MPTDIGAAEAFGGPGGCSHQGQERDRKREVPETNLDFREEA